MHWYGWFVAITAALGGFLFGYEIGIINQVLIMKPFRCVMGFVKECDLDYLEREGLSPEEAQVLDEENEVDDLSFWLGLTTASFLIGCVIGSASQAIWQDKLGRRRAIFIGSFLFAASGVIQALAPEFWTFFAGRIVGGIGVGILSAVVPLYIAEVSPQEIRGRLTASNQLMITIGIAFANIVNGIILNTVPTVENGEQVDLQWQIALGVQAIPGGLLFLAMFILPFSPRFLMNQGKDDAAMTSLAKLKRLPKTAAPVQEEFHEIKQAVETERLIGSASWGEMFRPGIRNRLGVAMTLQFFQQWTGINVIMYYSTLLFIQMGYPPVTAGSVNTVINSIVNVFGTFPGMWAIERYGRRKLMVWGGLVQAVCMWMLVLWVSLVPGEDEEQTTLGTASSVLGTIFMYLYVLAFASTWGPVVWVYQSEIFPLRIRGKGTGLATLSNWINNTFIAFVWPFVTKALGAFQYTIFGTTGLMMAGFAHFMVPETKGKTLEEMDAVFGFSSESSAPKS